MRCSHSFSLIFQRILTPSTICTVHLSQFIGSNYQILFFFNINLAFILGHHVCSKNIFQRWYTTKFTASSWRKLFEQNLMTPIPSYIVEYSSSHLQSTTKGTAPILILVATYHPFQELFLGERECFIFKQKHHQGTIVLFFHPPDRNIRINTTNISSSKTLSYGTLNFTCNNLL